MFHYNYHDTTTAEPRRWYHDALTGLPPSAFRAKWAKSRLAVVPITGSVAAKWTLMLIAHRAEGLRELNPRTRFAMNWRLEVMAGELAAVREGRTRRLIVGVAPRHLKPHLASVSFPG